MAEVFNILKSGYSVSVAEKRCTLISVSFSWSVKLCGSLSCLKCSDSQFHVKPCDGLVEGSDLAKGSSNRNNIISLHHSCLLWSSISN